MGLSRMIVTTAAQQHTWTPMVIASVTTGTQEMLAYLCHHITAVQCAMVDAQDPTLQTAQIVQYIHIEMIIISVFVNPTGLEMTVLSIVDPVILSVTDVMGQMLMTVDTVYLMRIGTTIRSASVTRNGKVMTAAHGMEHVISSALQTNVLDLQPQIAPFV